VWVLDVTSDLGIPAAVAVAQGMPSTQAPIMGYGAHVDPALAVVRALTELAQMQAGFYRCVTDAVEGMGPGEQKWFTQVTVADHPWMAPHGHVAPPDAPRYAALGDAIDDVVARMEHAGLTVLWADSSRPDMQLSIVRTYAPGIRHFWNRYAPGRLYDVPPLLGWRDGGYGEADLNPRAMIL
jgi:ribosomal protein S12 methylthiotransferase accessory factor